MGTEELAYYTNAGKELPLTFVAAAFTAVLMPQMVRLLKKQKNQDAVALWGVSIEISYLFICFFVAACFAFAPQIMTILYSEKYLPGVQVFRIYSLVLLLRVTYFGMVLNSTGKTKLIFWSSVLSLGLNVALNYLLYLLLGFIGPAVATLLSITLVNLVQLVFTSRIIKVPFSRIFPWKKLLLYTLLNAAWGAIAYVLVCAFKLGTDAKSIVLCILMGGVIGILYCVALIKRAKTLWNRLNTQEPAAQEAAAQP
jgi:O-antigen/teichoic acid export membrane protein